MSEKTWGGEPFWGLGYDWDPDWVSPIARRSCAIPDRALREEMRANARSPTMS